MKTGKLIEAIMQYQHVSIEDLANHIGYAHSNVSAIIAGRRNITCSLAIKIGEILNVNPIVLMTNRNVEELSDNEN